jgi:hypothetical protein
MILGIDPGNRESAIVMCQPHDLTPCFAAKVENERIKDTLASILEGPRELYTVGIECVASYGMAVGRDVFETAEWGGRIREIIARFVSPMTIYRVYRREVKLHVCGSPKAKDANIRAALIDRYPATGGGTIPQVGTSKQPGPLLGFSKDKWAALGVAVTVAETRNQLTLWT